MATLRDDDKLLIVTRLACFERPTDVQRELQEVRKVDATLAQILYYDPTVPSSSKLGQKWKDLFAETRERFRSAVEAVPIANQSYRLRHLQRILDTTKSPDLQLRVLDQAAKETGAYGQGGGVNVNVALQQNQQTSVYQLVGITPKQP